jgi:hypothetical protein
MMQIDEDAARKRDENQQAGSYTTSFKHRLGKIVS